MGLMNKLASATNEFQTDAKKVLVICSAGLLRSPTVAKFLAEKYGYNTRAAGISKEYALIEVSKVLVYWADELVFLEAEHLEEFKRDFSNVTYAMAMLDHNKYQVLDIPDMYSWGDPELIKAADGAYNVHAR